jgi:lysophospholipase L1-like esterase
VTSDAASAPETPDMGEIEEDFTGTGPEVVILGDSVTAISRPWLRRELAGRSLKIAALWGEGLGGGPISTAVGYPIMQTAAGTYGAGAPEVAVVELGTNDCWHADLTLANALDGLRTIATCFAATKLVGVTITERAMAPGYDRAGAASINEALRDIVDVVVEWGPRSRSEGYLDPSDLIHPTPEGSELFARLVAEGVNRALGV